MSLLNKTFDIAKKASSVALDVASKKVAEQKQKKEDKERKFIEEFPYKYRYSIQQNDTTSVDLGLWEILERNSYVIYDSEEEPVYIVKGTVMLGKHHFVVTNSKKQVVGKINKALVNVPIPFMKERKTCQVELEGKSPFEMETCIAFGSREYTAPNTGMIIKADKLEREFQIFDKNNRTPIIHLYKIGFFKDKYIVGFNDECHKMLALLMTIGIDTIRFGEN